MTLGEKIGIITQSGKPRAENPGDEMRYLYGRQLMETVVEAVLAGSGREKHISVKKDDGEVVHELFAHPPITDSAEAQRIGEAISYLLERARTMHPHSPLDTSEMDTFRQEHHSVQSGK
jgi:hypothetical protein